jgi:hypothetical protein
MTGTWAAGMWGLVGGAALLIGALVGLYVNVSQRWVSYVMALGAGVLQYVNDSVLGPSSRTARRAGAGGQIPSCWGGRPMGLAVRE